MFIHPPVPRTQQIDQHIHTYFLCAGPHSKEKVCSPFVISQCLMTKITNYDHPFPAVSSGTLTKNNRVCVCVSEDKKKSPVCGDNQRPSRLKWDQGFQINAARLHVDVAKGIDHASLLLLWSVSMPIQRPCRLARTPLTLLDSSFENKISEREVRFR